MNKKKLGEEPVFPMFNSEGIPTYLNNDPNFGMSKRFYAACAAMSAIISRDETFLDKKIGIVAIAYEFADELLKQENDEN